MCGLVVWTKHVLSLSDHCCFFGFLAVWYCGSGVQFSVNYLNLQVVSSDMRWDTLNPSDLDITDGEDSTPVVRKC